MNRILIEPDEISPAGSVRLEGRRARHLVAVLRAAPGRTLRAAIVGRGPALAEVLAVDETSVELAIRPLEDDESAAAPVRLILALPRPKALRRTLQTAASFGVESIDLVNAWRVPASYFGSLHLEPEPLRREVRLGSEQGGRTSVPQVRVHRLLMPFLEDLGARLGGELRLLAHPGSQATLRDVDRPAVKRPLTLAIGPEGGWIDRELASFGELGFESVSLGPWTLRSEIAVAAALAQWQLVGSAEEEESTSFRGR